MRQLVYGLRFNGQVSQVENSPSMLRATARGASCAIETHLTDGGPSGAILPVEGGEAFFESEVVFTGPVAFQERGTVIFGDGAHHLRFSTVGQGYLGPSVEFGLKHGTVMWQVDGGTGLFAGAHGLITSNFLVGDTGELTDHHFGLLFVE